MADLDYALIKRFQAELGRLRQAEVERRRAAGLPALAGEDAHQHGKALVQRVVTDYESQLAESGRRALAWETRQDLVEALEARLFGAGSLQLLLEDESVENIDINGFRNVFVEYADGTTAKVRPVTASNEDLIETIQTLAAHEGLSARAFDVANVRVNLRLPDGSRLYAVQSVTREPVVSIRKHRHTRIALKDLIGLDTLDEDLADFLAAAVRARKNVMVAGGTSAGKTTLLRALAAEIDPEERILTVERSLELGLDEDLEGHPNAIAFEERLANAEGVGAVTMAELVRDTLRMNPSRVIVGEVLGDEVVTMLNAMTQGNDGSLSTIHANSSADVVHKIATYAIQAPERLPWEATVRLVASGLDFIVFLRGSAARQSRRRAAAGGGVGPGGRRSHRGRPARHQRAVGLPGPTVSVGRNPAVQVRCQDDLVGGRVAPRRGGVDLMTAAWSLLDAGVHAARRGGSPSGFVALLRLAAGQAARLGPDGDGPATGRTAATTLRRARRRRGGRLVLTRWPVAGLAAAGLVLLWPRVFGGAAAGRVSWRRSRRSRPGRSRCATPPAPQPGWSRRSRRPSRRRTADSRGRCVTWPPGSMVAFRCRKRWPASPTTSPTRPRIWWWRR